MLTESQIAALGDEARAKYRRLERLFREDGWQDVVAWAVGYAEDQQQRMLTADGWDKYNIARGAFAAFGAMVRLEETTYLEFEGLAAEARETAVTLDEIEHE